MYCQLLQNVLKFSATKVLFSNLLGNYFLDYPDTFEEIFDFYTFKNNTFEIVS